MKYVKAKKKEKWERKSLTNLVSPLFSSLSLSIPLSLSLRWGYHIFFATPAIVLLLLLRSLKLPLSNLY